MIRTGGGPFRALAHIGGCGRRRCLLPFQFQTAAAGVARTQFGRVQQPQEGLGVEAPHGFAEVGQVLRGPGQVRVVLPLKNAVHS
jgi:hypothetical protein